MNTLNKLDLFFTNYWTMLPLMVWILFWKGISLWVAAKSNKKIWFLLLLILNTFGILEIIYIFFVAKKKWADIKEIFSKTTPSQL